MSVFAAIAPAADDRLKKAVEAKFGGAGNHYKVADGQYLVYAPNLTSHQVSVELGAPAGGVGYVMILRVTSYAGWHSRDMWEWISTHLEPKLPAPDA
jgi:hypothetical protein